MCVIEDLVLFIYSVKPSCKFHWLLGLDVLHPTGTERPEFSPPSQPGHSIVGATMTSMQCAARGHLLSNSQH